MKKQRAYKALQALSTIYLILAAIVLVVGLIVGGITLISPFPTYNLTTGTFAPGPPLIGMGIGIILASLLSAISLAAFAQIIQVTLELVSKFGQYTKVMMATRQNAR